MRPALLIYKVDNLNLHRNQIVTKFCAEHSFFKISQRFDIHTLDLIYKYLLMKNPTIAH